MSYYIGYGINMGASRLERARPGRQPPTRPDRAKKCKKIRNYNRNSGIIGCPGRLSLLVPISNAYK